MPKAGQLQAIHAVVTGNDVFVKPKTGYGNSVCYMCLLHCCCFNMFGIFFDPSLMLIGLLQLTITWYKIRHAGGQAHYYSPTGTLKQRQVKLDWFSPPAWRILCHVIVSCKRPIVNQSFLSRVPIEEDQMNDIRKYGISCLKSN